MLWSMAEIELQGTSAFMRLLGLRFSRLAPDRVEAEFDVGPDHHHPWGGVHGGVLTAVIETVATAGAFAAVRDTGRRAVGVSNVTDFLRPAAEETLHVRAEPVLQGRVQQLWAVVITRADGASVARGQVRLQNIDAATPAVREKERSSR